MFKNFFYICLFNLSFIYSQDYDFSLEDLNNYSSTFGENIGPSYFPDNVYIVYFGHYN